MTYRFADILLPVAVSGRFTYEVPVSLSEIISAGSRVVVQFGNRNLYTGIVCKLHNDEPEHKNIRQVISVSDPMPVVNEKQILFWHWLSEYYMCTEGEVMRAGLPSAFIPEGNTSAPVVEKYKPREETFVTLAMNYTDEEMNGLLDSLKKAPKQADTLLVYLRLSEYVEGSEPVPVMKAFLIKEAGSSADAVRVLEKKGILTSLSLEVGRLGEFPSRQEPVRVLSEKQLTALNQLKEIFLQKEIALLHGVTSSGKTEIYIHLIEEQLKKGKQVLYMLPEIALTAQIVNRLRRHFGNAVGIYHSRFNDQERVEIWNRVSGTDPVYRLILGVRSSVFLPFGDLGLVIIDEEHDTSYKQQDPAPRYNGRDSAIMLASLHQAKTLLGSASPSIESYHNAHTGKYGLVELRERYGAINLPGIIIADTREAYRKKLMVSHFTPELLSAIDIALGRNEQIILFRNRRGFSPYIECPECGWIPVCTQCSVNLTYHKGINKLVCHYCGSHSTVPHKCGSCGSSGLATRGFGTEKIEDEIKIVFPDARIARMDQDSTRNRNAFNRLIRDFEDHRIDILIGTQMISKGLDFENLTVVGILNADNMLNFPDFRAHERSFQMMEQVSGRAGRRQKQGRVVIQTNDPANTIIRMVLRHDYPALFNSQLEERKNFNYPPFCRLIRISLRHKDRAQLNAFSDILGNSLKLLFGKRVLGPEFPVISQIQKWYIKNILIKIEREKPQGRARDMIRQAINEVEKEKGASGLRVVIDVDPY